MAQETLWLIETRNDWVGAQVTSCHVTVTWL